MGESIPDNLPFMLPEDVWGVCDVCVVSGNGDPELFTEWSSFEFTELHISNILYATVAFYQIYRSMQRRMLKTFAKQFHFFRRLPLFLFSLATSKPKISQWPWKWYSPWNNTGIASNRSKNCNLFARAGTGLARDSWFAFTRNWCLPAICNRWNLNFRVLFRGERSGQKWNSRNALPGPVRDLVRSINDMPFGLLPRAVWA